MATVAKTPWSNTKSVAFVLLLLGPAIAGVSGLFADFIPNPILKAPALILGFCYIPIFIILSASIRGIRILVALTNMRHRLNGLKPIGAFAISLALVGYMSFVGFYYGMPAGFTAIVGSPAHREYAVDNVVKNTRFHWTTALCPYRVFIQNVESAGPGICVQRAIAQNIIAGHVITLSGTESWLGFHFDNAAS